MVIYTRTGDAGTTALFIRQRMSKTHPRVEIYSTLDKLNVALSLYVCAAETPQYWQLPEDIQLQLSWFSVKSASENEEPMPKQCYISSEEIAAPEAAIDTTMGRVSFLCSFILPDRREAASRLYFACTLTRRAERRSVELFIKIPIKHALMRYISHLSDCLHASARAEGHDARQNSIIQKVAEHYLAAVQAPAIKEPTMPLSLQELHQLTHAVVARAEEPRVSVIASIVDTSGTQMAAWCMPDALFVSDELVPEKAWITAAMKTAIHELTSVM